MGWGDAQPSVLRLPVYRAASRGRRYNTHLSALDLLVRRVAMGFGLSVTDIPELRRGGRFHLRGRERYPYSSRVPALT